MNLPDIPHDKALHYLWGGAAALGGAWLATLTLLLLHWRGEIAAHLLPWLLFVGLGALLAAWSAGVAKETLDHQANSRAWERYVAAVDAAVGQGALPPPPFTPPHEVDALDVRYTVAGCVPVLGALALVALLLCFGGYPLL